MRDSRHLSDLEKQVAYIVRDLDPAEVAEMARLGVMLTIVHDDSLSGDARATFATVCEGIAPDFLLTFRALRGAARHIIRKKRNWRSRT